MVDIVHKPLPRTTAELSRSVRGLLKELTRPGLTPAESVEVALRHAGSRRPDVRQDVLDAAGLAWFRMAAVRPAEAETRTLRALYRAWARAPEARPFLESVLRRMTGNTTTDRRTLADAAALLILKRRFPNAGVTVGMRLLRQASDRTLAKLN